MGWSLTAEQLAIIDAAIAARGTVADESRVYVTTQTQSKRELPHMDDNKTLAKQAGSDTTLKTMSSTDSS